MCVGSTYSSNYNNANGITTKKEEKKKMLRKKIHHFRFSFKGVARLPLVKY